MRRSGLSMLEVLVAIAVIGILMAILIPAVQSARETSRNTACKNNLRQLGVAMHAFESAHGVFPPGRDPSPAEFESIFYTMLPQLGMQALYNKFDRSWHGTEPEFHALQQLPMPILHCPSESVPQTRPKGPAFTSYAGNRGSGVQKFGYNGMFRVLFQVFPDRLYRYGPLGAKDFPDGLSNTAAMAEWLHIGANQYARLRSVWQTPTPLWEAAQLDEFAAICASVPEDAKRYGWRGGSSLGASWLDPDAPSTMYNHVLPPGNPSCSNATHVQEGAYTANSLHPQGVNLLYADGHVSFVSKSIDLAAWRDIGSRIEYDLLVPLD